eukprot:TRINITY_DN1324_c0_g1_i1.p2 TRINITY_DN1324_c0_g1~~TRINITY_DN1324_c0_g1_i1.p2  ORF type:complete len:188 (-),score=59.52 TRINITY_DN1324_c0_g1_i1:1502-2065(-)
MNKTPTTTPTKQTVALPSQLYPFVHQFLEQNKLFKTLKSFEEEINWKKNQKKETTTLLEVYQSWISSPDALSAKRKTTTEGDVESSTSQNDLKKQRVETNNTNNNSASKVTNKNAAAKVEPKKEEKGKAKKEDSDSDSDSDDSSDVLSSEDEKAKKKRHQRKLFQTVPTMQHQKHKKRNQSQVKSPK